MSTSVSESGSRSLEHARAARRYLVASLACVAFAVIYAQFSHGVYSPFMSFMFAVPLIGGACLALALYAAKVRPAPRQTRQAWAISLAALTIGSCLVGIFQIAGTASPYVYAYPVIAAAFAVVAIVLWVKHADAA